MKCNANLVRVVEVEVLNGPAAAHGRLRECVYDGVQRYVLVDSAHHDRPLGDLFFRVFCFQIKIFLVLL